jgi:hypothetical protein
MNIVFFTEYAYEGGKLPRTLNNIRTDLAWMIALNADNYSFESNPYQHDLGILIVPKNNPYRAWNCFHRIRNSCARWAIMQEGPNQLWQDWSIDHQFEYFGLLSEVDIIFCHNEFDQRYYRGLIPGKKVEILQSLMIEDSIPEDKLTSTEARRDVVIGGNFVQWYSGMDSFIIAQELSQDVYVPSMGRMQADENKIEGLHHLPYMNWSNWILELSERRYAVHLMRTFAAGTFALNCAALGIPCIGYRELDSQRTCFPELSVQLGDLQAARKIAINLKKNELFYNHVSEYAKKAYYDNFREEIFISKFQESIK